MVDMNFFNTTMAQLDQYSKEELPEILKYIKEGQASVMSRLQTLQTKLSKQKDYLVVETPV